MKREEDAKEAKPDYLSGIAPIDLTVTPSGPLVEQAVFRSVPREYHYKQAEKETLGIPKPTKYHPRFDYSMPRTIGKVGYGEKVQWESTGYN